MGDPSSDKISLRRRLAAERRALDPARVRAASERIAEAILELPEIDRAGTVALYQALRNEIGMEPLWRALAARGKRVLFPRVRPDSRVLAFAPVDDPAELVIGSLGVREPPAEREVPIDAIDLFVVPGLAFDREGRRLGRGGGYYDATLAAHPAAFRVGPCLETIDRVPAEHHDEAVDLVVTPDAVHRPSRRWSATGAH